MTRYQQEKAAACEYVADWLAEFAENAWGWGEVAEMQDFFLRLARRYGLVREFRENGII